MIKLLIQERNAVILGLVSAFFGVTYLMSLNPPFLVKEKTRLPISVQAGGQITICREVEYLKDTSITITRSMERWDEELNAPRSRQLESIGSTPRGAGNMSICRDVKIPIDTSVGRWKVFTDVEAKFFPGGIWRRTFRILTFEIDVIEPEKR